MKKRLQLTQKPQQGAHPLLAGGRVTSSLALQSQAASLSQKVSKVPRSVTDPR